MFNGEQKEAFVVSYPNNKREEVLGLLQLFSPYEETWGGDLVLQPIDRLQPAFDTIVKSIAAKKAKTLLAVLKKYREWYLSEHELKAVCAGVLLLKLNTEATQKYSMVASPRHLKLVLDEVFDQPEHETVDCVYRGFMWLAFAGVPRILVSQITVDEVDFYNMVIHHGDQKYSIPVEGLKEFRMLCELDSFLVVHKNPDWESRRPRAEGNQLLRGLGEAVVVVEKVGVILSQRFMKSKWSLNYESMLASGLFYEKYELERFGLDVSFDAEVEQRLEEMKDSSISAITNNRSLMKKRYKDRYNQWKMIFYPTIDK